MKYLWIIFIIAGCAQQQINLKENELKPFKTFSQKTKVGEGLKSVIISQVSDNRSETSKIGMAYTGVQYDKTPIYLQQSVEDFVELYFSQALRQRRFALTEVNGIEMQIEINELWVEEVIEKYQPEKAKCKANLTFFINNAAWSGNYWTEITSPGDLGDGTEKIAPTLASCLNEVVEKLVNDPGFISKLK